MDQRRSAVGKHGLSKEQRCCVVRRTSRADHFPPCCRPSVPASGSCGAPGRQPPQRQPEGLTECSLRAWWFSRWADQTAAAHHLLREASAAESPLGIIYSFIYCCKPRLRGESHSNLGPLVAELSNWQILLFVSFRGFQVELTFFHKPSILD